MGLVINTNVSSLIAQRNLANNSAKVKSSFEKLASGLRINRAADDAAGLSISETLKTQINGNQKAVANAQDGINILQIAEGALNVIGDNLQRIRELTVQAANDTNASVERTAIAREIAERMKDINRIAESTRGSNVNLLNGTMSVFNLQIGANSDPATNVLDVGPVMGNATCESLGFSTNITAISTGTGGALSSGDACRTLLNDIDDAITSVSSKRSHLGALQNRLESTIESLSVSIENLKSTNARIRDLDIAAESAEMTKNQILQQSALSVLAQANQSPQLALKLLQ